MLNIVLVEPEIPPNTGNIARTCAAIGSRLHIVGPIPFDISHKEAKRAGLDYWEHVDLVYYKNWDAFIDEHAGDVFYFVETGSTTLYTDISYADDPYLVFGSETRGLPKELLTSGLGTVVTIPTLPHIRCLNLSNAVAIAAYEVVRQQLLVDSKTNI